MKTIEYMCSLTINFRCVSACVCVRVSCMRVCACVHSVSKQVERTNLGTVHRHGLLHQP